MTSEVRLGDVANFVRGLTFKPTDVVPLGTPGSIAVMRTKNVQSWLDTSDTWAIDSTLLKKDAQLLRRGDLLVSSANSWNLVGKCCEIPELPWPATFGGFVSVLRPSSEQVDPRYLYRWFSSREIQDTVRSFGQSTTNISNLNTSRCLDLPMPVPNLSQQRRIASILDHADALRTQRRAALAQLDELTHSVFVEMFGDPGSSRHPWPIGRFADLIESTAYGTSEKSSTSGTIPVLRMGNITYGGDTDLRDLKYMELSSERFDRYTVRAGDLLFNRTNSAELVGKSAVYRMHTPAAFAGYLIRVRSNELSNTTYLGAFLNSRYGKRKLRSMAKSIVGMANINARELRGIPIAKPPIELQNEFADQLGAIESLKVTHRASLVELDALFASLQHRAFRGEL